MSAFQAAVFVTVANEGCGTANAVARRSVFSAFIIVSCLLSSDELDDCALPVLSLFLCLLLQEVIGFGSIKVLGAGVHISGWRHANKPSLEFGGLKLTS
jgi:hypothetical protein